VRLKLAIGSDGGVALPPRDAEALGALDGDPVDLTS